MVKEDHDEANHDFCQNVLQTIILTANSAVLQEVQARLHELQLELQSSNEVSTSLQAATAEIAQLKR